MMKEMEFYFQSYSKTIQCQDGVHGVFKTDYN